MTFDVFRCMEGRSAGNVDYHGQTEAASWEEAENLAEEMIGKETNSHIDLELVEDPIGRADHLRKAAKERS